MDESQDAECAIIERPDASEQVERSLDYEALPQHLGRVCLETTGMQELQLPKISATELEACAVRPVLPDGKCGIHSALRGRLGRDAVGTELDLGYAYGADKELVRDTQLGMSEEVADFAFTPGWENFSNCSVDHIGEQKLLRLCITGADNRRERRRRTLEDMNEIIADKTVGAEWLHICHIPFLAQHLRVNIAVWEASSGGGIRLYQEKQELGLYIARPEKLEFVHMLYSIGSPTVSSLQQGTATVRDASSTDRAVGNHFDALFIPRQLVPFLPDNAGNERELRELLIQSRGAWLKKDRLRQEEQRRHYREQQQQQQKPQQQQQLQQMQQHQQHQDRQLHPQQQQKQQQRQSADESQRPSRTRTRNVRLRGYDLGSPGMPEADGKANAEGGAASGERGLSHGQEHHQNQEGGAGEENEEDDEDEELQASRKKRSTQPREFHVGHDFGLEDSDDEYVAACVSSAAKELDSPDEEHEEQRPSRRRQPSVFLRDFETVDGLMSEDSNDGDVIDSSETGHDDGKEVEGNGVSGRQQRDSRQHKRLPRQGVVRISAQSSQKSREPSKLKQGRPNVGAGIVTCRGFYQSGAKAGDPCTAQAKPGNNGLCARHSGQWKQGLKKRKGRFVERGDAVGDAELSDDGSEGATPGDLADYEEDGEERLHKALQSPAEQAKALSQVPESWAKRSLKMLFKMMGAAVALETNRKAKRLAREEAARETRFRADAMVTSEDTGAQKSKVYPEHRKSKKPTREEASRGTQISADAMVTSEDTGTQKSDVSPAPPAPPGPGLWSCSPLTGEMTWMFGGTQEKTGGTTLADGVGVGAGEDGQESDDAGDEDGLGGSFGGETCDVTRSSEYSSGSIVRERECGEEAAKGGAEGGEFDGEATGDGHAGVPGDGVLGIGKGEPNGETGVLYSRGRCSGEEGAGRMRPPLCSGHGEECLLQVVRTQGPNFGRRFWRCRRADRNQQCSTNIVVDDGSVSQDLGDGRLCRGHGEPCRVAKIPAKDGTGIRLVYRCARPTRDENCGHLEEVDDNDGHPPDRQGQGEGNGVGGASGGGVAEGGGPQGRTRAIGEAGDVACGYDYFEFLRKRDDRPDSFRPSPSTRQSPMFPAYDKNNLGRYGKRGKGMGDLAFGFFSIMFPPDAVNLLVKETNDYFTFCTTTPDREEDDHREDRHKTKKKGLGRAVWPEDGISVAVMYGVLGIVIALGLVKLPTMSDHWDLDPFHDFVLVRGCLTRDMFLLIYGRFFHMASGGGPKRNKDGTYPPDWDALHHIRGLETVLNNAWSTACEPGRWISFDEQMVLVRSRVAKFMLRHMPNKPIKNGMKLWAVACSSGYCFLSYGDGGFVGDPNLRRWAACPLGRVCRMVLFVLFDACEAFAAQIRDSGIYLAMDKFFSSPILFLCLFWHGVFAVGTLRSIYRGAKHAVRYWSASRQSVKKKGEMAFARYGFLSFAQWKDSRIVHLLSTIHVKRQHFSPLKYSKRAAGDVKESHWQPFWRFDYNKRMGGVDIADQLIGYYLSNHRARAYFWRRVFEHKLMQACANAWLLFKFWVSETIGKVNADIETLSRSPPARRHGTPERRLLDALQQELKDLKKVDDTPRADWVRALCVHLLDLCAEGNAARGGKRARTPAVAKFKKSSEGRFRLKRMARRRHCESGGCLTIPNAGRAAPKRCRTAKTNSVCFCTSCARVGGVIICESCHAQDKLDAAAYKKVAAMVAQGKPRKEICLHSPGS